MTAARNLVLIVLSVFLFAFTGAALGEDVPAPGTGDRCAVCGMFVAPYPAWVARIDFKDGTKAFFDGPKDMFVYFFDLEKYKPGAKRGEIAAMVVTEYYSAQPRNAGDVFFVTGSDVLGPMGYELVPVEGKANAETFLRDHGGKKIVQFNGLELVEIPTAQ